MPRPVHLILIALLAPATGCTPDPVAPSTMEAPLLAKAAATGDLSVTTYVADVDGTVAPVLQIRSDGLGAYRNSSSIVSIIQSIGAWVLDTKSQKNSTRQLWLDFSNPVPGSGPGGGAPIAIPSGLYKVRAIAKCNLYGSNMLGMVPGSSMPCPLHIAFDQAGASLALQMNPSVSSGEAAPETDPVTVTCVTPTGGNGSCTGWRITPSGSGLRNVARLIKYVTAKGTTTAVNQGDYYLSFAITVTNP